ncbi:MAG: TIGR04222 domain-containing membrane protein [Actinomycetota bacterium]|nr:TIGR04222 domain-containing membrane protein [Actinomycetota bacterium]
MVISAANTWGISGSGFLEIYGGLCALWALALWAWRKDLIAPEGAMAPKRNLGTYELAVLNGGPELAVMAAAARLRAAHVLEPGKERHTLQIKASPSRGADRLEREVFEAVVRQPGIAIKQLRREIGAGPEATAVTRRLVEEGLLLDTWSFRWVKTMWIWVLPLLGLGIARIIAGLHNHKPVGYLFGLICVAVVIGAWLVMGRQRTTQTGAAELRGERVRARNWRAAPAKASPSRVVALFGGSALWAIDPAFASACSAPRERAAGWVGTYAGMGTYGGCGGGGGGCGGGGGGGGGSGCGG